jgi:hypothetical protein
MDPGDNFRVMYYLIHVIYPSLIGSFHFRWQGITLSYIAGSSVDKCALCKSSYNDADSSTAHRKANQYLESIL